MRNRWIAISLCLVLGAVLWGCATPAPATDTPVAATATSAPATETPVPATATAPTAPTATETATTAATATATTAPAATETATITPTTTGTATTEATQTTTPEATTTTTATAPAGTGWEADGEIADGEYAHTTEAAGVTLYWTNDEDYFYGALSAQTAGWVAVGLDPENRMQGANFVLGYVQDGEVTVLDMYGVQPTGPGSHPPDDTLGGTDDIVAAGGREEGGVTVIEFQIPLDSEDDYDKELDDDETYPVILARGDTDDPQQYHAARGYSEITID